MKICFFFNYNPLYRLPIYQKLAETFDCDFFFGNNASQSIAKFETHELKNIKGFLCVKHIKHTPFFYYKGLKKLLNNKYDAFVITGEHFSISLWLLIFYTKLTGKRLYTWEHGLYEPPRKGWQRFYLRSLFKMLTGIFLYNNYAKKFLIELGCDKRKIRVIHNSLNTEAQTEIFKNISPSNLYIKHFNNRLPVVIYIGRIQKRKKINQLIDAIYLLNSKLPKVNLVIVGGKDDDDDISRQVDSLHMNNNVWFYGPSYNEEYNALLLYNASVCVCPNGVGLTAIHSLTYGTPVISNDDYSHQMPEFEAIINNVTGSFFKTNDVNDLAKHIDYWCNISKEERNHVRDVARETIIKEWSVQYQIDTFSKELLV